MIAVGVVPAWGATPRKVTLQLKWQHQFQFAGYYAAHAQGFYQEAGLDVEILPSQPGEDPVQQVVQGKADFGVGATDLLLLREKGAPVVALAVIFQHSPLALMTLKQGASQNIHDIAGRKVMLEPGAAELLAYLRKEGISPDKFTQLHHSFHPKDLLAGNVDAMSAYVTDEPFELRSAGQEYVLYTPRSVGIDFYGENLFTTESQIKRNPEMVKAFRAASLKGWEYAMQHPEEVVQLIYSRYTQRHSLEHLRFEASQMVPLLQASLLEIGHMNPGRWRHIAETYAELGMIKPGFNFKGFLYDPNPPPQDLGWLYVFLGVATLVIAIVSALAVYISRINTRLRQEVAERRQVAEVLRESEERHRRLFRDSPDAYLILEGGVFVECNRAAEEMLRGDRGQIVGKPPDLISPEFQPDGRKSSEAANENIKDAQRLGTTAFEWVHRRLDGSDFFVDVSITPTVLDGKSTLFTTWRDITKRKQAESALREREKQLQDLFTNAPVGIFHSNLEGRFLDANPALAKMLGYSGPEELLSATTDMTTQIYADPAIRPQIMNALLQTDGWVYYEEVVWRRKDHRLLTVDMSGRKVLNAAGAVSYLEGFIKDITERKLADEAFRRSEKKFRFLFELSPVGLAMVNHETGKFLEVNDALLRQTGYAKDEFLKLEFWDITPIEYEAQELKQLRDLNENGVFGPNEKEYIRKDGSRYPIRISGALFVNDVGEKVVWGIIEDITERKRAEAEKFELEAQNRQLQKSESLGLMAGSIAHHFNNKLQSVMGNLELMGVLPEGMDPTPCLIRAKQATEKAAEVSRLMLVYLGQTGLKRDPCFLSELCRASLPLLQNSLPSTVILEAACPAPGPVIHATPDQIHQVLTNLITNALEAMGDTGGCIRINLGTCPGMDIPRAHRFPVQWQPQGQDYAYLEVADTGCGIAGGDIEKLFDPFFSSKFTGRGLGLSVVLGIVQAHDAAVTVESKQGQGSVFRIYFPATTEAMPDSPDRKPQPPNSETWAPGGTVLLVDDDEMLLESSRELVEIMGFTVLTAKDGIAALEVFQQHSDEIRCVVTDLTMPRMDGWGTLSALRRIDPTLPVIMASGYDKAQVMSGTHPDRPQAFLEKPFTFQQLWDSLAQVLGGKETSNGEIR